MSLRLLMKRPFSSGGTAVGWLTTIFLASVLVLAGCDSTVNQEGDATTIGGDSTDASTTINNPPPEDFDAVGSISGRVMDRVTNEPLEGVTVSLFDSLTATTSADGSFSFAEVPVNTEEFGGDEDVVTTYNVHINVPDDQPYRSSYSAEVSVPFSATASGTSNANNLGANVTFPLAKTNGSVSGTVETPGGVGLEDADVRLKQDLIVRFNTEGPDDDADRDVSTVETVVGSTTSGSDGSFSFSGVEVDSDFDVEARFQGDEFQNIGGGSVPPSTEGSVDQSIGESELGQGDGQYPPLTATLEPGLGTDFDTTAVTWTLTFNRPVNIDQGTFEDRLNIDSGQIQMKADKSTVDFDAVENGVQWSAEFNDGVKFDVELNDGGDTREVEVDYDGDGVDETPSIPATIFGSVSGQQFGLSPSELNGAPLVEFNNSGDIAGGVLNTIGVGNNDEVTIASDEDIGYSIGEDDTTPGVPSPSASFATTPDYTDQSVSPTVEIPVEADNIKGYQFQVSTVNDRNDRTTERWTTVDGNIQASDQAEFDASLFDANDAVEGVVTIQPSEGEFPFATPGGSYGDIEWRVRAVSINNETSDWFTAQGQDAIQDGVPPAVAATQPEDATTLEPEFNRSTNNAGTAGQATIDLAEPVREEIGGVTINDADGNDRGLSATVEVNNSFDFDAPNYNNPDVSSELTVTLPVGSTFNRGDQIVLSGVQDLKGNTSDITLSTVDDPAPSAPTIAFDTQNGNQPDADYLSTSVAINLESSVDPQEVDDLTVFAFYAGESATVAQDITNNVTIDEFSGDVTISGTADEIGSGLGDLPLVGDDDPTNVDSISVYVTAENAAGAESDPSNVLKIGDVLGPKTTNNQVTADGQEEVTVSINEPLSSGTVEAANIQVVRDPGGTATTLNVASASVDNSSTAGGTQVTITLGEDGNGNQQQFSAADNDEIRFQNSVQDLEGNGFSTTGTDNIIEIQ